MPKHAIEHMIKELGMQHEHAKDITFELEFTQNFDKVQRILHEHYTHLLDEFTKPMDSFFIVGFDNEDGYKPPMSDIEQKEALRVTYLDFITSKAMLNWHVPALGFNSLESLMAYRRERYPAKTYIRRSHIVAVKVPPEQQTMRFDLSKLMGKTHTWTKFDNIIATGRHVTVGQVVAVLK